MDSFLECLAPCSSLIVMQATGAWVEEFLEYHPFLEALVSAYKLEGDFHSTLVGRMWTVCAPALIGLYYEPWFWC